MRVRRAHECEVQAGGDDEVVREKIAAGEQALVLDAAHGLAAAEAGGNGLGGHGQFAREDVQWMVGVRGVLTQRALR